jgi:hypothetical protein
MNFTGVRQMLIRTDPRFVCQYLPANTGTKYILFTDRNTWHQPLVGVR